MTTTNERISNQYKKPLTDFAREIKELEDNIASGLNKKGKPFSPEKIQSMKDSLQQKKEKV